MNSLESTDESLSDRDAFKDLVFCRRLSNSDPTKYSLGIERNHSEMRQLGGLLVILGIGAANSALALTAAIVEGSSGTMQIDGFMLPALIATLIQVAMGMVAMAVGFITLVATPISKTSHRLSKILIVVVNLGPISFVVTVIRIAMGANEPPEDNVFIPYVLIPTQTHIRFAVAMGILGLISVCASLIGGLTVVALNLNSFLGGHIVDKHRGYYVVRFGYYSVLVFIGGFSQRALGALLGAKYGWGPYDEPIHVAVYTVFFPSLTIVVGAAQTIYGIYGWCRGAGWLKMGYKSDYRFMIATMITWLITMTLQIIVQPSYGGGVMYIAEGATYASVYLGNFVMPAWLDYMVRVTPSRIDRSYYSLPEETQCKEDFLCRVFKMTEGAIPSDAERCSRVSIECSDRSSPTNPDAPGHFGGGLSNKLSISD